MIDLTRCVRFHIALHDSRSALAGTNNHAGTPSPRGMSAFFQLDITCRGTPDPTTGYLLNIAHIDQAARQIAPPHLRTALAQGTKANVPSTMHAIARELRTLLPVDLEALTLHLSQSAHCTLESLTMETPPTRVLLTQSYSFAASHRLHCPSLTDEQNRETFGKCNNPSGHGHNYKLDVTIKTPLDDTTACSFEELDSIVLQTIIDRYDHKHLNIDTPDFATTNPSVEHIAQRCFELLASEISAQHPSTTLHTVRVWETDKTCATISETSCQT
jgi:6-pyruvoyltetrahydropterin/6-carboxytetrahydropterin synthase